MLVRMAVKEYSEASLQSLDYPTSWESSIAQQLSPAAAAKALGAIGRPGAVDWCDSKTSSEESSQVHVEVHGNADMTQDTGTPTAADTTPADVDELWLTETETELQQELHGAGVVVGFRLWQLFRRLLRDKELMVDVTGMIPHE